MILALIMLTTCSGKDSDSIKQKEVWTLLTTSTRSNSDSRNLLSITRFKGNTDTNLELDCDQS